MPDFQSIKKICEANSKVATSVIDEFLIYYAASRNNLEKKIDLKFKPFSHLLKRNAQYHNLLKAQLIAHHIFKKGGPVRTYPKHRELKDMLGSKEMAFIEKQVQNSWRFCFSEILDNPEENFFKMVDVFNGEEFLLHSPGTQEMLQSLSASLWFNLIQYNGSCYQSFGPIIGYKSFDPDDIFYFATEVNPNIESDEDLLEDLERNPVPYMMLLYGANYPLMIHKEDELLYMIAAHELTEFDTRSLKENFIIQYAPNVYQLELKGWEMHPHFAKAFYNEEKKELLINALTQRGFTAITDELRSCGFQISEHPDVRIHPAMATTLEDIFSTKISMNPYEGLFDVEPPPERKEELDRMNRFIGLLLPEVNKGLQPDIKAAAKKAGLNEESAMDIWVNIREKFGEMDTNNDSLNDS